MNRQEMVDALNQPNILGLRQVLIEFEDDVFPAKVIVQEGTAFIVAELPRVGS